MKTLRIAALLGGLAAQAGWAQDITLGVDATDLDHKLLRVTQTLAVAAGPLTLYYPRWLPGTHSPVGDVTLVAGLQFTAGGRPVPWQRDPLDTHAFKLNVPAGATALTAEFQLLGAATPASGRVIVTREMLNVQWISTVLYPAGRALNQLTVKPSLVLPAGWQAATALRPAGPQRPQGASIDYAPVPLDKLADSPVFAGRNVRRIELDPPGTARPVALTLVADTPELLQSSEAQIEAHRELVRQSDRLFASRHFAHYDFLLAISDELGGIGLEHHESSENGVRTNYWKDWDKRIAARQLLPHEYAHSWNGKFRRPADLTTPNFNVPMQDSLLWVYEGQTQFWGFVLAARSGLTSVALAQEQLARIAASYAQQAGRQWRNLQDTTNDPIMGARRGGNKDWYSWQRGGGDYYNEALLVWLDADSLIREKSGGKRSLDDFARAFFGVRDGELGPLTYTFDDVVAALNAVQPHDWAAFLRQRLEGHGSAPLDGLARGGWKLVYAEQPSDSQRADEGADSYADLSYSLGLTVGTPGGVPGADAARVGNVVWNGAAFRAGVVPGSTLVAVNGFSYKAERLKDAITANKAGARPVELLLRDGERFATVRIDYRDGLRYPRLERIAGSDDRLGALLGKR